MALRTLGTRVATLDTRRAKPPPKFADPFYLSADWLAFSERVKKERGLKCEDPNHKGLHEYHVVYPDHIVELRDGGAKFDRRNILLRCPACHGRKTFRARAVRMAHHHKAKD